MNPQIEAALIAGIVSLISLGGTVVVAVIGFRTTRSVTGSTLAEQRTRTLNERFATAAGQLGSDKQPALRLAGVYAMASLADDWPENRQTCIDVLCAYLRLPYDPAPGTDAGPARRIAYQASREVRHTAIRLIGAHLRPGSAVSWQGLKFDFTGAVFDGCDFHGARFSGGEVDFTGATFSDGQARFRGAEFSGAIVLFTRVKFSGGQVGFDDAEFSGGTVDFYQAEFSGAWISFNRATFSGGQVRFGGAEFSGSEVWFYRTKFSGSSEVIFYSGGEIGYLGAGFSDGTIVFEEAEFTGGQVLFGNVKFSGGTVYFTGAGFSGGTVSFTGAEFTGGTVSFGHAEFPDGTVNSSGARFTGGTVDFRGAGFSGGTVSFAEVVTWSHPPLFSWDGKPPQGLVLPAEAGTAQ